MLNENMIIEMLDTKFVQLTDVWAYSPNTDRARWNGNYEKVDSETRPMCRKASFDLRLTDGNALDLTTESVGIYVIRDDISIIYIGKTEKRIEQRFNAHISKLTAVRRHNHPKRWRDYAVSRLQSKGSKFEVLDEFEMSFYDFSDFEAVLKGASIKEQVEDMEALVFYGLCVTNPKERFLNTEGRVGTRESRDKWKGLFNKFNICF